MRARPKIRINGPVGTLARRGRGVMAWRPTPRPARRAGCGPGRGGQAKTRIGTVAWRLAPASPPPVDDEDADRADWSVSQQGRQAFRAVVSARLLSSSRTLCPSTKPSSCRPLRNAAIHSPLAPRRGAVGTHEPDHRRGAGWLARAHRPHGKARVDTTEKISAVAGGVNGFVERASGKRQVEAKRCTERRTIAEEGTAVRVRPKAC